MRKRVMYAELAYVIALCLLTVGAALMERADFGMSMVVAPAYIIHLKVSQFIPFFTFGMSGYVFQLFLLIALFIVMGRFEKRYLLSFVTAFIYGIVIDVVMDVVAMFPYDGTAWRIAFFVLGVVVSTSGVADPIKRRAS